jgi:hypothetical protein
MFWLKMAIIRCIKFDPYKETAVFASIIIDIYLLSIILCICVCVCNI